MEATETYKVIIRHGPPNQYDHAEQGTICKVLDSDGRWDIYKQQNKNESQPVWVRV
jgi:hypothetical protein